LSSAPSHALLRTFHFEKKNQESYLESEKLHSKNV
jgi:hypothetical protein